MRIFPLCLATTVLSLAPHPMIAASFQGLGDVAGGNFFSNAQGISGDGTTVVGQSTGNSNTAFIWTATGGIKALYNTNTIGIAYKADADGKLVAGRDDSNGVRAVRVTVGSASPTYLGGLNPNGSPANQGRSFALSDDGAAVVGSVASPASTAGEQAFRYTSAGGLVGIGFLGSLNGNGSSFYSEAHDVSANGSVAVGFSSSSAGQSAFRYTAAGGMLDLGRFVGDTSQYRANAISGDGNVIVGSAVGNRAFTWTQAGGISALPSLSGAASPLDADGDGGIIVGADKLATDANSSAVFWMNGTEFNLKAFLLNQGNTAVANWDLRMATGISTGGSILCGTGIDPSGNTEAFIANITVPEPSARVTLAMAGLGLALFGGSQRLRTTARHRARRCRDGGA